MSQSYAPPLRKWNFFKSPDYKKTNVYTKTFQQDGTFGVAHSRKLFFRFSFLIFDLLTINTVNFCLLQVLDRVPYTFPYLVFMIASNCIWIGFSYFTALYFAREKFFKRTGLAFMLYATAILFFIFLTKYNYSRFFVLISFSTFGVALVISRTFLLGTQQFLQNKTLERRIIFLGCNELSNRLAKRLSLQDANFGFQGYFDDDIQKHRAEANHPLLGTLKDSLSYAIHNRVTEIYSTIPPENNPHIYEIAQEAERNFIRFKFVPDFRQFIDRKVHLGFEEGIPILTLHPEPLHEINSRFKKRIFDVVFSSLVILLVLSWLLPVLALLIKLNSRGPVFFKQLRSGKNNLPFLCYKFRTLQVNSESDSLQVARDDHRYTRLGKFLRKTNLDELPQFFNVFQGHMSVVGPRPHMLKHTKLYASALNQYMVRHFVKPGVTGLAQISGYRGEIRKQEQLNKRVECDINYMENWSMWLDCRIILLTIYTTIIGDKNAF